MPIEFLAKPTVIPIEGCRIGAICPGLKDWHQRQAPVGGEYPVVRLRFPLHPFVR